jgi:hypothetical protein
VKKMFAMLAVVLSLLVPPQVVMAEVHDSLFPLIREMSNTGMMLDKTMMMMMEKKKMMMTPAQKDKLMKMLKELNDLLNDITTKHG